MECEKVRERFSSLLEGELNPREEKIIRGHLASCSECQKEFKEFEKTINWLQSVGEVEVPDGFLTGIYQEVKDRKRKISMDEKTWKGWFRFPISVRLPIQAVAMVAVVFFVIYLTKMMPVEKPQLNMAQGKSPSSSVEKKAVQIGVPKDITQQEVPNLSREIPQPSVSGEKKVEGSLVSKRMREEGKGAVSSEKIEMTSGGLPRQGEVGMGRESIPKVEKKEEVPFREERASLSPTPSREIVLRVSDREKVLFQLQELVRQFGGEVKTVGEKVLLASLPVTSFPEFEKEVVALTSSVSADKIAIQKDGPESLGRSSGMKRKETERNGKEAAKPLTHQETHLAVRIFLLQN